MSAPLAPVVGEVLPPQGATKLVTDPNLPPAYTANRETDVRTAVCRGLKEYTEQLTANGFGGRMVQFKKVHANWAQPDDKATYPSAAIWSEEMGKYDAHAFTPTLNPAYRLASPDHRWLVKMSEFEVELIYEVWANDNVMREELCAMLESAFAPVDFMFGFRLQLPHYFNERATYEPLAMQYMDDEESAMRRWRLARFHLRVNASVLRLANIPVAIPKTNVKTVSTAPLVLSPKAPGTFT